MLLTVSGFMQEANTVYLRINRKEYKTMNEKPLIISCALTGSQAPKSKNPAVPVTPEEIAESAYAAWKAGAAVVHLHMRDERQAGCMDPNLFAETIRLIREKKDCDVIINCTSSGGITVTHMKRLEHFINIPEIEMGSYDAGTLNWGCDYVFPNPPKFLEKLGALYQEHDIVPEIEIFDPGFIGNAKYYIKKGFIKAPGWFQLVLGVLGGSDATPEALLNLKNQLPEGALWSATGVGKGHLPILYTAIAAGADGVRVGLEDNIYYDHGVLATNEDLVARAVRVAKEFNRPVATPAQAREILGIKQLVR